MKPELPEPKFKTLLPGFLSYPVNFAALKAQIEPHLAETEFSLHFAGADSRLIKNPQQMRYKVFWLWFTPKKHRTEYWMCYSYGVLRTDKKDIRDALGAGALEWLLRFISQPRTPVKKNFYLSRYIRWNAGTRQLECVELEENKIWG